MTDFPAANNNSDSFTFKQKITGKNVKIMVSFNHLSNFWRTHEMPLTNCEIKLNLTWSDKCVLSNDSKATTFPITDRKPNVPVVIYQLKITIATIKIRF